MEAICTTMNTHIYVEKEMGVVIHVDPNVDVDVEVSSSLLSSLFTLTQFQTDCFVFFFVLAKNEKKRKQTLAQWARVKGPWSLAKVPHGFGK